MIWDKDRKTSYAKSLKNVLKSDSHLKQFAFRQLWEDISIAVERLSHSYRKAFPQLSKGKPFGM